MMSWYSDGESMPWYEYAAEYGCKYCNYKNNPTRKTCQYCEDNHGFEFEERCENCYHFQWDAIDEIFICTNSKSDYLSEEVYAEDGCPEWEGEL